MPKILIRPEFNKEGGEGGIKRVVEAQLKHLPKFGWDIAESVEEADLVAVHATTWVRGAERKPVVTHCHGLYWAEYNWNKWEYEANQDVTKALLMADAVTAPSNWVANAIARGTWLPVQVLGHGIDLDEWQGLTKDEGGKYVLWNKTRPDPICDPTVVEVLASMCRDIQFLSTFGEQSANLRRVAPTGYEEHKKVVANAGLYLCTTRETFGIGTLEALACGVPVVGWNWGGQAEFVTSDVGYLAPVGDYDSLRRGIYHCIEHHDELSANARRLVQSYDWSGVIGKYADLYDSVLAKHKGEKRVSVVVPSYNLGQYLPECLKSVVSQLTAEDELIIVDDCSTDGSLEIARNCNPTGEADVTIARTPTNLYLAGALNYGIGRAKGRYILPLDADNYLLPGALDLLAGQLDKDRGVDVAYGRVRFVDDDGREKTEFGLGGVSSWPPSTFSYADQMAHKNQIPSTAMYRKKVWERIGGYRLRCKTAEDADFWCRATSYGARPKLVTEAPVFTYRDRAESMSHTVKDWPWHAWYKWAEPPFGAPGRSHLVPSNGPPVVSVIIPVGPGHELVVMDALDSVFCQTFPKWECIVVDDSHDINWLPSWMRYYRTPMVGSGVSTARNIGISVAKGQYFLCLDADDYLEPVALEAMFLTMLEAGPQSYVYSDYYRAEEVDPRKIAPFDHSLLPQMLPHPITCLFPMELHRQVQFDESMRCGEDWDYVVGAVAKGYCGIHVPYPLMYYRRTSGLNRQQLVDNLDNVRQRITSKWGTTLGCSCNNGRTSSGCVGPNCGSSSKSGDNLPAGAAMPNQANDLLVEIEFLGEESTTRTYNGRATGKTYRFGNNEGHKIKFVDGKDAEWFLSRGEFRRADATELASV